MGCTYSVHGKFAAYLESINTYFFLPASKNWQAMDTYFVLSHQVARQYVRKKHDKSKLLEPSNTSTSKKYQNSGHKFRPSWPCNNRKVASIFDIMRKNLVMNLVIFRLDTLLWLCNCPHFPKFKYFPGLYYIYSQAAFIKMSNQRREKVNSHSDILPPFDGVLFQNVKSFMLKQQLLKQLSCFLSNKYRIFSPVFHFLFFFFHYFRIWNRFFLLVFFLLIFRKLVVQKHSKLSYILKNHTYNVCKKWCPRGEGNIQNQRNKNV